MCAWHSLRLVACLTALLSALSLCWSPHAEGAEPAVVRTKWVASLAAGPSLGATVIRTDRFLAAAHVGGHLRLRLQVRPQDQTVLVGPMVDASFVSEHGPESVASLRLQAGVAGLWQGKTAGRHPILDLSGGVRIRWHPDDLQVGATTCGSVGDSWELTPGGAVAFEPQLSLCLDLLGPVFVEGAARLAIRWGGKTRAPR